MENAFIVSVHISVLSWPSRKITQAVFNLMAVLFLLVLVCTLILLFLYASRTIFFVYSIEIYSDLLTLQVVLDLQPFV